MSYIKLLFVTFLFQFSQNSFAQYFNKDYGRPDPYIETVNSKAFMVSDSNIGFIKSITRYVPGNYRFFPSITIINKYGNEVSEIFPTDSIYSHYYSGCLKISDDKFQVVGGEYKPGNINNFTIYLFDHNFNKLGVNKIGMPRNQCDIGENKSLMLQNIGFCGQIQTYDTINKTFEESQAILYKLDSEGNEIWHTEYGDSINSEKFYDFTEDEQGNIYAIGQWVAPYFDGDYQSLLVKYDKNGTLLWSKKYGDPNLLDYFTVIHINSKNELVINGGYGLNTNLNPFNKRYGRMIHFVLDSSGIVLTKKEYGIYGSVVYDCVKDSSDYLTCAGQTYEPDDKKTRGFVAKFNAEGDTLWTRRYDTFINGVEKTCRFNGIAASKDNGYILTGARFAWFGVPPNSFQGWVVKVDSLGYDHNQLSPVATHEPEEADQEPIITFYPNPTSGELFYRYKDVYMIERKTWVVSFYDLQGIEVKSFEMNPFTNSLLLSSLPDGV
ncbi:MAG: hypothetical protein JNK41_04035, partial [Saprospiraceae bacterium]|nr:hypothetical protein [Saprospiraceae bacterium]